MTVVWLLSASLCAVPTFNQDVAPLLYEQCSPCHRPGEVAPFSLLTYEDARKRGRQIAAITERRLMPPWKADPHYGAFQDARVLDQEQIGLLAEWVKGGMPEGAAADRPPVPEFTNGWQLGEPDLVVQPEAAYDLAAEGADVYRCFVVPTDFDRDRYVSAIEVRPGQRSVVHHVIAYLDNSGRARQLDAKAPGPGYTSFGGIGVPPSGALGGWAPGLTTRRLPPGVGVLLPKGCDIVLQVHYHKSGKPETDLTKMGLWFCQEPVDKRLRVFPIVNPFIRIPPGDADYQATAGIKVPADVTILQVTPHMHLLGRSMTVEATLPDGRAEPLVRVPDWDFNWQTSYTLAEPLHLPQGSRINLTAKYDNSVGNPYNPNDPPRLVTWGEQTTDEMCIAFVSYTVDAEHLAAGQGPGGIFPDWGARQR